jgi:hypothetical protein
MVKILSEGLLPPDDPMFSNGLGIFSLKQSKHPIAAPVNGIAEAGCNKLEHLAKTEKQLDLNAAKDTGQDKDTCETVPDQ